MSCGFFVLHMESTYHKVRENVGIFQPDVDAGVATVHIVPVLLALLL